MAPIVLPTPLQVISRDFGMTVDDNVPLTSSRYIAERFGKRHDHVLRDIEQHLTSPDLGALDWIRRSNYGDPKGEMRPCYLLTRNGFMFVVSAYTGDDAAAIKIRYFLAFDAMEAFVRYGADSSEWPEAFHLLRQTLGILGIIERKVDATYGQSKRNGESLAEVRHYVKTRRREISDKTKGVHVDGVNMLGGLCPADGRTKIVEAGQRIPYKSEFDHFYQNSKPDEDHTWLISVEMHAKLTSGQISRDKMEGAFRLYQDRRRELAKQPTLF